MFITRVLPTDDPIGLTVLTDAGPVEQSGDEPTWIRTAPFRWWGFVWMSPEVDVVLVTQGEGSLQLMVEKVR